MQATPNPTTTAAPPKAQLYTNAATGESVAMVPQDSADSFSMAQYLNAVTSEAAFEHAKALATAYDKACSALIGKNDVQKEGSREFKKKSAWRKLQRHFRINTIVRSIRFVEVNALGSVHNGDRHLTIAEVTVEAVAPWGQVSQAVGACGFDEESEPEERHDRNGNPYMTKGKELSLADMVATAETRATNRAVSNLIAMGEVSAEEINRRNQRGHGEPDDQPHDDSTPRAARGPALGPSEKQSNYIRNLAKASAVSEKRRAEILEKLETAIAEQWPRERVSAFVDQVKSYVDTQQKKAKAKAAKKAPPPAPTATAGGATPSGNAATPDAASASADATKNTTPTSPTASGTTTDDDGPDFETLPRDFDMPGALHDDPDDGLPF